MTHQYMELKLKELEKRIKALEQEPTTKNDLEVKKETITYLDGFADGLNMANNSTNKMLDKIYADIQKLRGCSCSCSDGIIDDVEDILDKYKAETEAEDA